MSMAFSSGSSTEALIAITSLNPSAFAYHYQNMRVFFHEISNDNFDSYNNNNNNKLFIAIVKIATKLMKQI